MAISEAFSGSPTIGSTEYFCASASTTASYQTTDGVYQLQVDLAAVAKGDVFVIRAYEKVVSSGTTRKVEEWRVANAQGSPVWVSPTLIFLHGWEFSLQKAAGTDRSLPFSIRSVS